MACEFEDDEPIISVLGCTDPLALNYFSGATIDNGSCVYPQPISGCTDPNAINYNEEATIEDCSCIYSECPNILVSNSDGSISYQETYDSKPKPLGRDCCTEQVVGTPVTWDGTKCVNTNRIDCPTEIVIKDGGVVYYNKPIQYGGNVGSGIQFGDVINETLDFGGSVGGTNQLNNSGDINLNRSLLTFNLETYASPLGRDCCTEEVVGEPVTWDPSFVINGNREPGACILDNLPQKCDLTLEDVIYVGDTVVINCLPSDDNTEDNEDDLGDIIDDTKDCVDIIGTMVTYPQYINESTTIPLDNGPYLMVFSTDENVLNLSQGSSVELSNFGTIEYDDCGSLSLDGLHTIIEILVVPDRSPTTYAIILSTQPNVSCNGSDIIPIDGVMCPVEYEVGDTKEPPICYNFDQFQFQFLSLASNFPDLGADYQTLCNENNLNGEDYYLYVSLSNVTNLPTACENYEFNQAFFDALENSCWGPALNLNSNSSYKLLYVNTLGGNTVALFNISIPFDVARPIEIACGDDVTVNGDFQLCGIGNSITSQSIVIDGTTDFSFSREGLEESYTENIVFTYNQTSSSEDCGKYYTNNSVDLDPTIFNCTTRNTILSLNFISSRQKCCNGYFQITIIGPNNFQETIRSNQTQEIILPVVGEYEITLDLVYFNCGSSISVISKTPQPKLNRMAVGEITSINLPAATTNIFGPITTATLPASTTVLSTPIDDPCEIDEGNNDPTTCPNLDEFCCKELGSDLGWEFIDGVCYWNPPSQTTDVEIGVSESDISIPDSECTDLDVSLFFYLEKPSDPQCIGDEDVIVTLAFYSGDSMNNDNIFTTTEISNFTLSRDGYCDWTQISTQINNYAGEEFKIKLILSNVIECCNYDIYVDDIRVDCTKQDSITVNNKFQCPGFKLDRVIDNKKSWVYNDGLPINRVFAPSPDADLPWRYTDYLQQSGVYEKHSKLVLNSKEMELTFNMCNTSNCKPVLNIFELLEYKNKFQSFWVKFIEQFVPATTIFIAGEKWCTKEEDICPTYNDCDYNNDFNLEDLGLIREDSSLNTPTTTLTGQQIGVNVGVNTPTSEKSGDWGKNNRLNGEPIILEGFLGSFIKENSFDIQEKLTFKRGELPLLKEGMRTYINKFSKLKTRLINE